MLDGICPLNFRKACLAHRQQSHRHQRQQRSQDQPDKGSHHPSTAATVTMQVAARVQCKAPVVARRVQRVAVRPVAAMSQQQKVAGAALASVALAGAFAAAPVSAAPISRL
jgi:hypothetical protein